MRNILKWLESNFLTVFAGFLIVFIPLYPKIPFADILPGYIVRVRLDDFAVAFSILLWLLLLLKKKITLNNPLFKPILIYLAIGFISMISAVFITQTIPMEKIHLQKMILHYLRRIEYFSLFFIFYSTIKNIRIFKIYLTVFIFTVLAVALYGFGQKYLYWPAFSTMNREFAKGWMLYLTRHARVISTFAGHYDLAAFIMMALIILWSLFFTIKKWFFRVIIFLILICAFWTLILTASRTSFIAYIAGISLMFFFWAYKKGLFWSISRWLTVVMLSILVMLSFGDLSERFTKLLRIDQRIAGIKSLLLSPISAPPKDKALFLENSADSTLAQITSKSDQPPTRTRPSDVFQDIPLVISTASGTITVSRTYSKTAFTYDLSTAIRFDALWPMAIKGFKKNPLVGSGYSSLNKIQLTDFTEAESTDNDYLRSLGETGLLGFVSFFGTLIFIIYYIWRNIVVLKDPLIFGFAVGVCGIVFGLMVNAIYIDVFESSKVAYSFWTLVGCTLGGIEILKKGQRKIISSPIIPDFDKFKHSLTKKLAFFITSDSAKVIFIIILAFCLRLYKINTPLADWHSWRQADTSAVTRNYIRHGINILYPTYDDLSSVASGKDNPKGLRFVEFPLYNIFSVVIDKIFVGYTVEISGRLTSIFASIGAIIFLYKISKKYLGKKGGLLTILFFAILPFNIYYNRVILPEPFLVFTSLGMIYYFNLMVEEITSFKHQISNLAKIGFFVVLSFIFTAASILVKPFSVFLFIPMAYICFKKMRIRFISLIFLFFYLFICLLPFIWWRSWMNQFPEGIPANLWLLNGDGIRFKGAFFYWIFADRLVRLILGYYGITLLILGILYKAKKEGWFINWWIVSMILYFIVVATGNVRHDYYQVITIPIISILLAKGVLYLIEFSIQTGSKIKIYGITFLVIFFMEMFGWYHIRDFYNINHPEIVEAGQAFDRLTKNNVLVIAPYNGDTAFLYQTGRAGWPIVEESIDNMIAKGAQYYVSVNFDQMTNNLIKEALIEDPQKKRFKIIELNSKYVIIQLVPDKDLPK